MHRPQRKGLVTQVTDLGNLEVGFGEDLPELSHHLSRPIVTAENRRLPTEQSGEGRTPLDLGIQQLDGRLDVAALEALHPALEDVNTLLRHRPRSIPILIRSGSMFPNYARHRDTACTPMSPENFEVIRRAITALNDRDIDRYLSCCTEDVQLQPAWAAVVGGAYEGPDGIRRFFSDLGDIAPDFRIEIERLEPMRTTRVLAFVRVHATGRASGITSLPGGQPEATSGNPTAIIYDFADGKIEHIRVIMDREEARQLADRP